MTIKQYYLRSTTLEDIMLLYRWRNELSVRKSAFRSDFVAFGEHKKWLQNSLKNGNRKIYILMLRQSALGQVRIDIENGVGVIDYSIDKKYRGKGLGKIILQLLEQKVLSEKKCNTLIGYVKKENVISNKIFKSLNYMNENNKKYFLYKKCLF
ncbi:GNAT family N-acetyltransferase [Pectinatus frisingensis]|uniref:GNAT family N-acetyltransferase n=1 Tax=Pectinatus frisingensis TaxID=865 RepID=UPI0018C73463|nr:GNAT family N-acetyltransferase [Pectinatus frisingensis]